ncbi:N-6 DNA methylase [Catellatospora methionotrophica]|uniref:N-6 DNA methylase n=1 Tax=Catellatospora methionotrophica TaxID=121620 RepID=UPI0033D93D3C
MPPRARAGIKTQTTQQRLAAVIKRSRDVMRTDPGLNGDLDRLPQMAWLLFLKAYDDLEEHRAVLDADHQPLIAAEFRWRAWARDEKFTGDDLLSFINSELFPYLKTLPTSRDGLSAGDVISGIFQGVDNRMRSGYQLRELINELNKIHFDSIDDIHTMARLYESMLREVRDAAGDSGEFYTPRPVIRFMVQQIDPHLGEAVLDPAAGTGGFLIETLEHLRHEANSVTQRETLQASLRGFEKKSLPYLLSTMNMLLHEVDAPRISLGNSLQTLMANMSKASQVDVVLTNPPFGGAENAEISKAYPKEFQTSETAWLFLYLVIEILKPGGRCGIVVPNNVLVDSEVGRRIKAKLFTTCNVHTIIRLPDGVFAPYTDIPSNLIFFEKGTHTEETWFYQLDPPAGRKKYTKTRPLHQDEFLECQKWWGGRNRADRVENEQAWRVSAAEIRKSSYNLDFRNPSRQADLAHLPPSELIENLAKIEQEVVSLIDNLPRDNAAFLAGEYDKRPIGDLLVRVSDTVAVEPDKTYVTAGIYSYGRGLFSRGISDGATISYPKLFRIRAGQLVFSRLFAWEGAITVVTEDFDGLLVSPEFPVYDIKTELVDPAYLAHLCRWPGFHDALKDKASGMGNRRQRVNADQFEAAMIPLPSLKDQMRIVERLNQVVGVSVLVKEASIGSEALRLSALNAAFGPDISA